MSGEFKAMPTEDPKRLTNHVLTDLKRDREKWTQAKRKLTALNVEAQKDWQHEMSAALGEAYAYADKREIILTTMIEQIEDTVNALTPKQNPN